MSLFQTGKHDVKSIFVYSMTAIVLGMIMDYVNKKLDNNLSIFKQNRYVSVIAKILLIALVFNYIQDHISAEFASDWQSTTPGVFFVSIFFGLQSNLFSTLQAIQSDLKI